MSPCALTIYCKLFRVAMWTNAYFALMEADSGIVGKAFKCFMLPGPYVGTSF